MSRNVGVFVGRLCPIHLGHQRTIDYMINDVGEENALIVVGSIAQRTSMRVLFSYWQRKKWIKVLYGKDIKITGVPDFPTDNGQWLSLIMDNVHNTFGQDCNVTFYGGSVDDVEIFANHSINTKIVDRTDVPISGTVVRDMMLSGMDVSRIIDYRIHDHVVAKFSQVMADPDSWEINR